MNKLLTFTFLGLALTACSSSIDGEGTATSEKAFTVDQISNLNVSCNCTVTVVPGAEVGVKVESHQNIIDNLKVEGKNGKLTISENKQVGEVSAYDVFVYVTRDFKEIEVKKQTLLNVSGTLTVDDLNMKASDQAKVDKLNLITNNLKLAVTDQAVVNISGSSVALIYKGSNQSQANLFDLETNDAQIFTSDNAILEINSRKSLSGSAKGNSIVTYIGDPSKDTKVTDNAQVIKK